MRIAAVVVGTNERPWLETCLRSLGAAETGGAELRVYYVDNASTDGSVEFVTRQFPAVQVTRNRRNLGYAGAGNVGLRRALADGAEYLLVLNPDTQTPPGLLVQLVSFLREWPEYGAVGPLTYEYDRSSTGLGSLDGWSRHAIEVGERHVWYDYWPDHPSPASPPQGRAPRTLEHCYVHGAALFLRARALRTAGLFDPVLQTYYDEVDLCRRLRWAGWRVAVLLDAGIQHFGGGGGANPGQERYRRIRIRRNRYYYLFTDIDWPGRKATRLAARWLAADLRARGLGVRTGRIRTVAETLGAVGWLLLRTPQMVARRRQHRRIARAASPREPVHTSRGSPDAR